MNKLLILTFILSTLLACDAPVRTRYPSTGTLPSGVGSNAGAQNVIEGDSQNNASSNGNSATSGNNGNNSSGEPGFENCDLGLQYSGGTLGYFGLCQHSSDERRFKAIFAQASTEGTCFIPIYVQNGGTSYKLGIAQCVHNQANTPYYMTLNKELMPPTFSYARPEQINGVMVIKSSSVNAYMGCMNAKEDYLVATYGCCYQSVPHQGRMYCLQTNPNCENPATTYANNVCSSFVQNHSNNYRQVSF